MASSPPHPPATARAPPASSRELLGTFQPGSEAEPPDLEPAQPADTTPTVLNKLQKWVRPRRRCRRCCLRAASLLLLCSCLRRQAARLDANCATESLRNLPKVCNAPAPPSPMCPFCASVRPPMFTGGLRSGGRPGVAHPVHPHEDSHEPGDPGQLEPGGAAQAPAHGARVLPGARHAAASVALAGCCHAPLGGATCASRWHAAASRAAPAAPPVHAARRCRCCWRGRQRRGGQWGSSSTWPTTTACEPAACCLLSAACCLLSAA